jgi:hypothetical protein
MSVTAVSVTAMWVTAKSAVLALIRPVSIQAGIGPAGVSNDGRRQRRPNAPSYDVVGRFYRKGVNNHERQLCHQKSYEVRPT